MKLNVNYKFAALFIILCSAAFATVIFSNDSMSQKPYRTFSIILPEEISAEPGQTVTIDGGLLNTGWIRLHDFSLTLTGLTEDYTYSFSPQHWDELVILREWDSDVGVYRVPEKFQLTITIPDNAAGLQLVTVKGQEMWSSYQMSNTTQFVLKVTPAEHFTVSNTSFPENATEGVPFDVKVVVTNDGSKSGTVTLNANTPEDWTVTEKSKSVTLDPKNSSEVVFTITPTITSGNITITAEYPYKENVTTITKIGPLLVPIPKPATATTMQAINITEGVLSGYFSKLFSDVMGLPLWVIVIAAILVIIILWNIYKLFGKYKFKVVRGKPEETKNVEMKDTAMKNVVTDAACGESESFH